jgi:hypothetical protein
MPIKLHLRLVQRLVADQEEQEWVVQGQAVQVAVVLDVALMRRVMST